MVGLLVVFYGWDTCLKMVVVGFQCGNVLQVG